METFPQRAKDDRFPARATIRDVAHAAGVAVSTVSRMLNNSGPVSAKTRLKVEQAAIRLGYIPHAGARSLITSRTLTIGVLLPDLYGEFYSEVIRGIDQTAQRHQYHVLVSSSHNEPREIQQALRLMHGRVDGLILMATALDGAELSAQIHQDLPVVLMNSAPGDTRYDAISVDNYGGAYAVVRHFVETGHLRIAMVKGPERNFDSRERLRGYHAALQDLGLGLDEDLEMPGDFTQSAGYRAVRALLRADAPPTALFAANDAMAVGALRALREAGKRVPDDVAVAGFDDVPTVRYFNPPLTSVHVPIARMGSLAVERLLHAITLGTLHQPRQIVIPTTLVVRESSGGEGAYHTEEDPTSVPQSTP